MRRLERGAAVGAALWVAQTYVRAGGNRGLTDRTEANWKYWSSAWDTKTDLSLDSTTAIAVAAVLGGGFGAGCVTAIERVALPRPVAGALFGLAAWAAAESFSRLAPKREAGWQLRPASRYAAGFAAHGTVVAVLT